MNDIKSQIAKFVADHPGLKYREIAEKLNLSTSTISNIAAQYGIRRNRSMAERLAEAEVQLIPLSAEHDQGGVDIEAILRTSEV